MSSFDSWDGDGGVRSGHDGNSTGGRGTRGITDEEEEHGSTPSCLPNTVCWFPFSNFEVLPVS